MRIAVDVRSLMDQPTGIGTYAAQLTRHLLARGDELVLFSFGGRAAGAALRELLETAHGRVRFVHHPVPMRVVRQCWRRLRAPVLERITGRVDLVVAAETTMPVCDAPTLAVVYDALWAEHPEWFPRYAARAGAENLADVAARASFAITISERSRRAILALHPELRQRLAIVTPAASAPLVERARNDDGTVLFVGTLEPRKGAGVLAQAMLQARGGGGRARLVVCGGRGWGRAAHAAALAALAAEGRCQRMGYASAATVARLRARCAVAVVPFLDEGFGMPLLEAMSAGAPVLASDIDVFHEVGGDAFAAATAGDAQAFAAELDALLEDEPRRRRLAAAGGVRAAMFSSDKQRRELDTALSAALDAAGRR